MAASDPGLCVLPMPESTNAFRFVYPTLIVTTHNRAFLWDVPSGKLIQTLHGCQFISFEGGNNKVLGRMKYVEISERHAFLVGQSRLRVFSRATGKRVWDLIVTAWIQVVGVRARVLT